jgi:hypothetical protein
MWYLLWDQGSLQRRDLFHDVRAIPLVLDHGDHPIEVATHGLQSVQCRLLVFGLHLLGVSVFHLHDLSISPHPGWGGGNANPGLTTPYTPV